ncbi:hypothetical protein CKO15_01415 [Halorhodospira abdelmalekii]|uniref:hypothetical protein n=1 Tax=Halorhodospira abdelmalekii TaxID=421629 RepID=UPI001908E64F|nr:hypothetical protein [Halorhodospira abdelmalekii]MBK1733960.1 hypothetical protein [Halorhodospira abdelmalekii]
MGSYLVSSGVIFGLLALWAAVQGLARRFAARHPHFGPAKEEGQGCGGKGGCGACSLVRACSSRQ